MSISLRISRVTEGNPRPATGLVGAFGGTVHEARHEESVEIILDDEQVHHGETPLVLTMASAFSAAFPIITHAELGAIETVDA